MEAATARRLGVRRVRARCYVIAGFGPRPSSLPATASARLDHAGVHPTHSAQLFTSSLPLDEPKSARPSHELGTNGLRYLSPALLTRCCGKTRGMKKLDCRSPLWHLRRAKRGKHEYVLERLLWRLPPSSLHGLMRLTPALPERLLLWSIPMVPCRRCGRELNFFLTGCVSPCGDAQLSLSVLLSPAHAMAVTAKIRIEPSTHISIQVHGLRRERYAMRPTTRRSHDQRLYCHYS